MKKIIEYITNFLIIIIVIGASFGIATYSLSKKIDAENELYNQIKGVVEKKEHIVISKSRGNIEKIYHSVGEEVKKGEKLADIINPDLESRVETLSEFENNKSAQTELQLAQKEIEGLEIFSPVNGYIDEISFSEGSYVNPSDKLFTIFSNENTRILFYLAEYEYKSVTQSNSIKAYNGRIDQYLSLKFSDLKPRTEKDVKQNKIGAYFTLQNPDDGAKLLHGEEATLILDQKENTVQKPLDHIKKSWMNFFDN